MFVLFGVFILACGTTHLSSVWTLWVPAWGLSGLFKLVTALASVGTAVLLWPMIPKALAVPGPDQWSRVNRDLVAEVSERRAAEDEVRRLNRELESRVRDRTAELEAANARLQAANQQLHEEVAARTRLATELRDAKAEAERANIAKSKFLAAASHDLRQPVQSLFWFFAALELQVRNDKVRAILDGMEQSLSGLRLLLDALLDASRLDAGIVVPEPREVPLGEVLTRLETELRPAAAAQGLRLRAVDSSLAVHTDPVLLERILRNFLHNALRYTTQGGVVIGCRRQGGMVRVEVVDTGPGIPVDMREAVFEEFVQLGNPERDRAKGLGLGLAIVRRLAALLGCRVGVRSAEGRGSCFYVELPALGRADKAETQPPAPTTTGGGGTVVVIEDERLVRAGLVAMLASWGYRVVEAESGDEALSGLGDERPALVLADYRLRGDERGPDAIRQVQHRFGAGVPAVILTGDTSPQRIREAEASGFHLLHKPVAAPELRLLVDRLAAG
jgi:signal transduction histidine kinase